MSRALFFLRANIADTQSAPASNLFRQWSIGRLVNSPLVTRLLAELAATSDVRRKALLMAELGRYRARIGEFDEAERIRVDLRRGFGDGRDIRVSVLIMVIEALQLYYRDLSPGARNWMARACLLSNASGDKWLIALTAAWMAHIEFNQNRFDEMVVQLATSRAALGPDCDEAECRAAIVLGDVFLFVGHLESSQNWYDVAHRAAVKLGDRAAIGAMTYNRAALRVARARFETSSNPGCALDLSMLRLDVDSAINYQSVAKLRSLDHLLTTTKIGSQILRAQFSEAAEAIATTLSSGSVADGSALHTLLKADYALCQVKLGRAEGVASYFESPFISNVLDLDADDRTVALASLHEAARELNLDTSTELIEAKLDAAASEHREFTHELSTKISAFANRVG